MSSKKTNMDVLKVQRLYDFKAFENKDYINFTKRAGGQVFQYYSLLDSYAKYLGANGGSDFTSSYRETEVVFSREIFKKRVYSSTILPLYSEDSSTNTITIAVGSEPGSLEQRSYFKPRVTPSWYDRHTNSLSFVEGDFRNIYLRANMKAESFTSNSISFVSGDFRLPLLTYVHREAESFTTTRIYFESGSLKKVLIKALIPTESFKTTEPKVLALVKSTLKERDIIEINFNDINYISESPKVTPTILDKFSTKIASPPEPKYLRVLNKRGGIGIKFDNHSSSISSYYDWTVNFNYQLRELRPDAYILDYPGYITLKSDGRDPSKLIVTVSGQNLYTSSAGFIQINTWYAVSIEKKGSNYLLYIDNALITSLALPLKTFFNYNDYMTIGNSIDTYNGFIGNISKFIIVKRAALITDSLYDDNNHITPIVGSELDFSLGNIRDKVSTVNWQNFNSTRYNAEIGGIPFTAGQYLVTDEAPDISMYNFNNFKIEVEFSISSVPTLDNKVKTLLHKTGVLGDSYDTSSGYSLSVVRVDDIAKLQIQLGTTSLMSSTAIRVNTKYFAEIIKYKTQLLFFVNNVFEGTISIKNVINEDLLSKFVIGRFQTLPERDFKGVLYGLKIINYFRDEDDQLMQYMPENLEYEEILTFEEGIPNWKYAIEGSVEEDYITILDPKFGKKALDLDTNNKAIIRKNTPLYNFKAGDFTIEGWYKLKSQNQQSVIVSNGVSPDKNAEFLQYLYVDSLGFLTFHVDKLVTGLASNILIKANKALLLDVWTHVVFTREKGVFKLYINGNIVGEVRANNVIIDFSINDIFIGNNNSKGNLLPLSIEPSLSDYIEEASPTTVELLEASVAEGGILTLPSLPVSSYDALTGTLTIGESSIKGASPAEIEALRQLHIDKYIVGSLIKRVDSMAIEDWINTKGMVLKSKPAPTIVPTSLATADSQFRGKMDSIRIIKDEALYTGNSFDVPSQPYGDTDSNTIIKLSFDHQYTIDPNKEVLLEFKPTPTVERVGTTVINADMVLDEELAVDSLILNFKGKPGIVNEGNFNQVFTGSVTTGKTPLYKFSESSLVGNTDYLYITPTTPDKNIFNFGKQDFTFDFWVYEISRHAYPIFFTSRENNSGNGYTGVGAVYMDGAKDKFHFNFNTKIRDNPQYELGWLNDSLVRPLETWNHIACTREGSTLTLFLNGKIMDQKVITDPEYTFDQFTRGGTSIGGAYTSYNTLANIRIDSIRVLRGKALFTDEFDSSALDEPSINTFVKNPLTTVSSMETLYHDKSISFNNSGLQLLNVTSDIGVGEDFSLEMYIKFSENLNRHQTIVSNVTKELDIAEYINIFRYGLTGDEREHTVAISSNSLDLDDTLIVSDQKLLDNVWYNLTLVRVNGILKILINGMLDSELKLPDFKAKFKNIGFRLGDSILPETSLKGFVESIRLTPKLSLYKSSFDTDNILLTADNSKKYNYSENEQSIYDSISKKFLVAVDNVNTKIIDRTLVTKLPDDTSKTGVLLPMLKAYDINTSDFTIEFKIWLDPNRYGRVTTVICNRPTADNLATFINISSDNATAVVYPFKSAITLYFKQSTFEFNLGENSYQEGVWNTIAFTKQGDTIRGYVNGVIKNTVDVTGKVIDPKFNAYGGLRLLDAGKPQAATLDSFYTLKEKALYIDSSYTVKNITQKSSFYETRYAVTEDDDKNVIPFKTFVENLYTKSEEFAPVTTKDSLIKSSLKTNTNTYIKLNLVPKIPKDFLISFWIKPSFSGASNSYYSIMKWESDDEYSIDYSITPAGLDKLTISKGSLSEISYSGSSGMAVSVGEWNHIMIAKLENTANVYVNGYRTRSNISPKYDEMSSGLPSTVRIGYNSSLATNTMTLLVDDFKLSKYREGSAVELYYDSLGTLREEYKLKLTDININNYDGSSGTSYWTEEQSQVESKFIPAMGKYYFKPKTFTSSESVISQVIDVSEYLDISTNKIYFSWTQSYDEGYYSYSNNAACVLSCYDKSMNFLADLAPNMKDVKNPPVKDREMERYIIEELPVNVAFIKISIKMIYSGYVTNLKMAIENTGQKFDNLYFTEEYIPPKSLLPYSHALLLDYDDKKEPITSVSVIAEDIITYSEYNTSTPKALVVQKYFENTSVNIK